MRRPGSPPAPGASAGSSYPPSAPPRVETVSAKPRSTAASSLTSQRSAIALPPIACRGASAVWFFSSLVPQMQTAAPACARASAIPRPMPLLPPVTIAVLPCRSNAWYAMGGALPLGPHAMGVGTRLAQRRGQLGELAEQRPGGARVDDLLDPERLGGAERG